MPNERGSFKLILTSFLSSLKPKQIRGDLVGKDLYGNSYYEIKRTNRYLQRPERYFVPAEKEKFDAEMPAEWESWLRGRRKIPPTKEEITASLALIKQKQINAAAIAEKFPSKQLSSPAPPGNTNATYPTYNNEYETFPGNKKD